MKFWTTVKKLDIFGIPVSLTHKGKEHFSSSFGSFLSIIFMTIVMSKGLIDLLKLWTNEIESVQT